MENPEVSVERQIVPKKHKISMATTSEATNEAGVFHSGDRAPEPGLASIEVTIPPTHIIGQLE